MQLCGATYQRERGGPIYVSRKPDLRDAGDVAVMMGVGDGLGVVMC